MRFKNCNKICYDEVKDKICMYCVVKIEGLMESNYGLCVFKRNVIWL